MDKIQVAIDVADRAISTAEASCTQLLSLLDVIESGEPWQPADIATVRAGVETQQSELVNFRAAIDRLR
jgi:hypothetical protein